MASTETTAVGRDLRRLFDGSSVVGLTEAQLLDRVARRDELTESAFEAILTRHGPAVLACCRRVLGDSSAAEDAFQAAFLVLFRRASSIRVGESVAPWLLHVARQAALKAREGELRRQARERRVARPEAMAPEAMESDLRLLVRAEVDRLPAKYRDPVRLCYFEGRTHDDAAAALGWPVGSVRGRLSRARDMLRKRLMRRGVGITPAALIAALASGNEARAEIPRALCETTLAATSRGAVVKAGIATLAAAIARGLAVATAVKATAVVLAIVTLISAGAGIALLAGRNESTQRTQESPKGEVTARAPGVDRYGDPLPKGATARLGSLRFRHNSPNYAGVQSVSFTPDGKTLASSGGEPVARIWDVATGREVDHRPGHPYAISGLVVSPADGTVFTAGNSDGLVLHWDPADGRLLETVGVKPCMVDTLAISPDGRTLFVLDPGDGPVLWDVAGRKEVRRFVQEKNGGRYNDVVFSSDSRTVTGGHRVWDVDTGRVIALNRPISLCRPSYTADGRHLITLDHNGVCTREIATGTEVRRTIPIQMPGVSAFSPDGRLIAISPDHIAISPDHKRIPDVANTGDHLVDPIQIWELASGKEVASLFGHVSASSGLAFSPDGRMLASVSGPWDNHVDPGLRIWDVASGKPLRRFKILPFGGLGVAYLPDGRTIVTGSQDGTALVWDVSDLADHRPTAALDAKALEALWSDLASDDAPRAHRASWALSIAEAVPFLRTRLRPPASQEPANGPEVLRSLRAIAALERVGNPQARETLEQLAKGDPAAPATVDAADALLRLARTHRPLKPAR
jgi:RNA polymerase sigma factor (sigma-70 family)